MTTGADIIATGLFDADHYLEHYPDIAAAGIEPAEHYAKFGQIEGRTPNAYFDEPLYRAKVGDIGELMPLLHYARVGDAGDIAPGRYFNPAWYRHAYRLPRSMSALADFLRSRKSRRRLPSIDFYVPCRSQPYATLDSEQDCFAAIIADLSAGDDTATDTEVIAEAGLFDANHYLINGSDVHEASLDPIEHFCKHGWREGRQPNIYFNTSWYIQTNTDVERLGINPLVHYIIQGDREGRRPIVYFDPQWYRAHYDLPDEQLALAHFLANRRTQRFSPNAHFNVEWYLQCCGSQVGPNRDPFAHYLQTGTYGDVWPAPDFDPSALRRSTVGRRSRNFSWALHPARDNPLIRYMHQTYS